MGDELDFEEYGEIKFEEKSLEAGIVYGHPIDNIYLRLNFPELEETLQIIMTEMEALAIIHMLSGVLLTSLSEEAEENEWSDRSRDAIAGFRATYPEGSTATDD